MRLEEEIHQLEFESERHKLALNVIYTASWLQCRAIRHLKPHGLSPQQYNVLRILRGQSPAAVPVHVIASRMLDRNSNVSRLIEKLRSKGWVNRVEKPGDRRGIQVAITAEGLARLACIDAQAPVWQDALRVSPEATLTEGEARAINDALDRWRG